MAEKSTKNTNTTGTAGDDGAAPDDSGATRTGHRRLQQFKTDAKSVRTLVARIVWILCVIFAAILAAAVLLIAIDANPANDLVRFVVERANDVDLGFFDLADPIKDFDEKVTNPAEDTKTALFNYGIAAIVWLVIGRILDRVLRP